MSKEFLDAPSPLGDRETRREAIEDYANNCESEIDDIKIAIARDDLSGARKHFEELKQWVDALNDNLCGRDENGSRKD